MLDIRLIREGPDHVKKELAKVGLDGGEIDALLEVDSRGRALITEVEQLGARRGEASRAISKESPDARAQLVAEMRAVGDRIAALDQELGHVESDFQERML